MAAAKEVADDGGKCLGVDELLGRHTFGIDVEEGHAFLDQTFGAGQTGAALVGEQFTNGTHAATAEVIDVVGGTLSLTQLDDVLRGVDDVIVGDDAGFDVDVDRELLVDLVASNAANVVALRIEEEALEQGFGVGDSWRISGTQATIDVFQCLVGIVGRILLETFDDGIVVLDVDDLDGLDAHVDDLTDDGLGQRFKGAGDDDVLIGGVADFGDEHLGADVFVFEIVAQLEVFNGVEQLDDVLIGAVTQ